MNELVKGLSLNDVVTYPHAFFKWVYANPCPSLVGIRRIPAYHVDYTTGPIIHPAQCGTRRDASLFC